MAAQPAKSRIFLKVGVVLVVIVVVIVATVFATRPTAVVKAVWRGNAGDVVTGSVVVHADKDVQEVKSESGGRVEWVYSGSESDPVKKGQPLVRLDASDLKRAFEQAEADYKASVQKLRIEREHDERRSIAEEALANVKRLRDRGDAADEDVKRAERAVQATDTQLKLEKFNEEQAQLAFERAQTERQRQIDKMTIVAPMDGFVQSVRVAPNALIGGGTTVATFFSNERVVMAKIGEEDIGKVKVGQPALLRLLNLPSETFQAKVTAILPFADPDTQRYTIKLQAEAETTKLYPFSTGEVTITVGEHPNQPLIDRVALFNDRYVWVVSDGVVHKREVQVGFKGLNVVEITGNLQPGERVIVQDVDLFRDGQRVRVKEVK